MQLITRTFSLRWKLLVLTPEMHLTCVCVGVLHLSFLIHCNVG